MKAVIVDMDGKYAIALDRKGGFIKIKNNDGFRVGYEVDIPPQAVFNIRSFTRIAATAAVFLLSISLGYGVYSYNSPYSYIDLDINPSVEITSNIYDRIIKIEGLNSDGEKLIASGGYTNKSVNDGIGSMLKSAVKEGYIKKENSDSTVLLTVSCKNNKKSEAMQTKIQSAAKEELKTTSAGTSVMVESVTPKSHDDAKKMGISPGKLLLIERAMKLNPDLKIEDLKKAPVKEIIKSIDAGKKENKVQKKSENETKNESKQVQPDNNIVDNKNNKDNKSNSSGANTKTGKVPKAQKAENKKAGNEKQNSTRNKVDKAISTPGNKESPTVTSSPAPLRDNNQRPGTGRRDYRSPAPDNPAGDNSSVKPGNQGDKREATNDRVRNREDSVSREKGKK